MKRAWRNPRETSPSQLIPTGIRIRAVTFDVGGTLIEPWPSVGHVYAEVAARFDLGLLEPAALNRRFADAWKSRKQFDYSRRAWQALVNQTLAGIVAATPGEDFFAAIYQRFEEPAVWRVFDDVFSTLAELKSCGLKLAVLSNWDERLRPLLARLELLEWFDAVIISHEVGHTKPAPEIFLKAAATLDLPPAAILHIGDSAREDVFGAHSIGMAALLLDRRSSQVTATSLPGLGGLAGWLSA